MSQKKQARGNAARSAARKAPQYTALWRGKRDRGSIWPLALLAGVGVIAIVGGYFMQNSALLGGDAKSESAASGAIRISEVMADNASTLITKSGEVPDWIEIQNTGAETVNLSHYSMLVESNINNIFVFPDCEIGPGEYVVIHANGMAQANGSEELNAPFKLGASGGDTLALLNAQNVVIDSVTLPEMDIDASYCRVDETSWQISTTGTPGSANVIGGAAVGGAQAEVQIYEGALEITEVMSSNSAYFADENGEFHDYVEIRNNSSASVDLEGWYLSDGSDKLKRWAFPEMTLPAGGSIAVHCSGYDRVASGHVHTNFKISANGESIYLSRPDGHTVSAVTLPPLVDTQAYSLFEGEWTTNLAPTPGYDNNLEIAAQLRDVQFSGNTTGLVISEIMASPSADSSDWVEIYNGSGQTIDLSNYGLSDDAAKPRKWQFPAGTTIAPGQYMGVYLSGMSGAYLEGLLNADFALAAEGGYMVCLSTPTGKIIDGVYLPKQYGNVSYGRSSGEYGFFFFADSTPGKANSGSHYRAKADIAEYSVRGGLYTTGQTLTVELSAPAGSRIYYTLDCTDPTEYSNLYTGPITITDTTILRTRVYRSGFMESYMDTQSYLFNISNPSNVYIISLVSDPDNLLSDEKGIMVKGPNALAEYPYGSMNVGANFWMDWEREAHVEMYSATGEQLISQECGIKLHGQFSRANSVKAFKIIARDEYGNNRFEYPIFSDRDYEEYQSFVLRCSGSDYERGFMRDSILTDLADDTSVMYQKTEIAICYLDGVYYSMFYIRERINTHSICQFEGWEGMEDDIDLIKANTKVMQGSNDTMAALLEWIKNNDTTTDAAYDYIASQIDIQNYIEYMSVQIFSGNTDTLNVKRYRNPLTDGKWRWVLFDLDWAFYTDTNSIQRWLTPGGMGNAKRTDNTLFIGCMKNPTFREQFLTYFAEQMATNFTTKNLLSKIEERYEILEPMLPQYLSQWNIDESFFQDELQKFINYAKTRPKKLLGYFQGAFNFSDEEMMHYFGDAIAIIQAES